MTALPLTLTIAPTHCPTPGETTDAPRFLSPVPHRRRRRPRWRRARRRRPDAAAPADRAARADLPERDQGQGRPAPEPGARDRRQGPLPALHAPLRALADLLAVRQQRRSAAADAAAAGLRQPLLHRPGRGVG